jgi:hypothetical protein
MFNTDGVILNTSCTSKSELIGIFSEDVCRKAPDMSVVTVDAWQQPQAY